MSLEHGVYPTTVEAMKDKYPYLERVQNREGILLEGSQPFNSPIMYLFSEGIADGNVDGVLMNLSLFDDHSGATIWDLPREVILNNVDTILRDLNTCFKYTGSDCFLTEIDDKSVVVEFVTGGGFIESILLIRDEAHRQYLLRQYLLSQQEQ